MHISIIKESQHDWWLKQYRTVTGNGLERETKDTSFRT
jgi:hypothetical protein